MNDDIDMLGRRLKVLSVGTRLRIIQLLNGRALCVNALAQRLGVSQSAISQHLRVLRDAGLVIDEKRGYFVHYRINEKTCTEWMEAINNVFNVKSGRCPGRKGKTKCVAAEKTSRDARSRKT